MIWPWKNPDGVDLGDIVPPDKYDENTINCAAELGENDKPQMIMFQLPHHLLKQQKDDNVTASNSGIPTNAKGKGKGKEKTLADDQEEAGRRRCKLFVYKSGNVKIKIGDDIWDVSPGVNRRFCQDVVAINTGDKYCARLGKVDKNAVPKRSKPKQCKQSNENSSNGIPILPVELIIEILLRLPVKSLLKFRLLLRFIQPHHHLMDCSISSLLYDSDPKTFQLDYPMQNPCKSVMILDSVNGLICLSIDKDLILWNPSIRKFKKFHDPQSGRYFLHGFGYDQLHDDYNLMLISKEDEHSYNGWNITSIDVTDGKWGKVEKPFYGEGDFDLTPCVGVFKSDLSILCNNQSLQTDVWIMKEYEIKES
ncbi:hypothetical protein H5410_044400 [Solanum commersonii]|uniref:F-box associated beta-propeller type 3 domain-containing protein n=1 Tax=Solanum commersonii TaxID=4109 RepID=A0A9J5X9L3_SOLCO|nr:hypothetical protein H5410_044400 [Solanum commersonii]